MNEPESNRGNESSARIISASIVELVRAYAALKKIKEIDSPDVKNMKDAEYIAMYTIYHALVMQCAMILRRLADPRTNRGNQNASFDCFKSNDDKDDLSKSINSFKNLVQEHIGTICNKRFAHTDIKAHRTMNDIKGIIHDELDALVEQAIEIMDSIYQEKHQTQSIKTEIEKQKRLVGRGILDLLGNSLEN